MAGSNGQNKKANRQNNRLSPSIAQGTSRVSKVVGAVGSESVRVEQRANSPATKQNSRPANAAPKSKRAQGSKQRANRPAYVSPPSPDGTADSRAISKARGMWSN